MIQRRTMFRLAACAAVAPALIASPARAREGPYFPPLGSREWATSDPAAAGWNTQALSAVIDYAQAQSSTGIVIVQHGRIVAERYWTLTPEQERASGRYVSLHHGQTPEGWPMEDVASIQKSVMSLLIGMARSRGLIDIDRSVTSYIGDGWSDASREQESAITVRHLLAMASGLDQRLRYEAPPGVRWFYNTPAYGQLSKVLQRATGRTMDDISKEWLTGPLGMADSRWQLRRGRLVVGNDHGFVTTPRDLARLGLLVLHGGAWDGRNRIVDGDWLKTSLEPSQHDYAGYGFLWWLNSGGLAGNPNPARQGVADWFAPTAPRDMIAARGHFHRRLYIVPSLSLVVVRLGPQTRTRRFDQDFWPRLSQAMPK